VNDTAMIGVDWGTSSLRLWRFHQSGEILESRHFDLGILRVVDRAYLDTFVSAAQGWLSPDIPILMSGMIGSREGWIEAPYITCPTDASSLADSLTQIPELSNAHIVPGLAVHASDGRHDVMRGEETQILGASKSAGRMLFVMPGTHSKWVLLEDGGIRDFQTFMTGELFEILKTHSILGKSMQVSADAEAHPKTEQYFLAGVDKTSLGPEEAIMQSLFSVRATALAGQLCPNLAPAYLSGLLVGAELREGLRLAKRWGIASPQPVIVGAESLSRKYQSAFAQHGCGSELACQQLAASGIWRIAKQRDMV
jgi:2-dehydro-3-deoxygalactonokinase